MAHFFGYSGVNTPAVLGSSSLCNLVRVPMVPVFGATYRWPGKHANASINCAWGQLTICAFELAVVNDTWTMS